MHEKKDEIPQHIKKRYFSMICTRYMDEFGFEWVEEFTLNGA